jgi:hypothetical protein
MKTLPLIQFFRFLKYLIFGLIPFLNLTIQLYFWYVKTHCSTLKMRQVNSSKILLPIYDIIQQYFSKNTNPGWQTPLILCTCKFHSLRSAGVCVCVCVCVRVCVCVCARARPSVRLHCLLRQYLMRGATGTFNKEQVFHIGLDDHPCILHCI